MVACRRCCGCVACNSLFLCTCTTQHGPVYSHDADRINSCVKEKAMELFILSLSLCVSVCVCVHLCVSMCVCVCVCVCPCECPCVVCVCVCVSM